MPHYPLNKASTALTQRARLSASCQQPHMSPLDSLVGSVNPATLRMSLTNCPLMLMSSWEFEWRLWKGEVRTEEGGKEERGEIEGGLVKKIVIDAITLQELQTMQLQTESGDHCHVSNTYTKTRKQLHTHLGDMLTSRIQGFRSLSSITSNPNSS